MSNNLDYEELQNALKMIQNVCRHVQICEICPFGDNDNQCLITKDIPSDWIFANPVPVVKLLK